MVFPIFSLLALSLVVPLIVAYPNCSVEGAYPTAIIASGTIVGTTTQPSSPTATVNKYLGIPFAQSPPIRFSPPENPLPWNSPLNATEFKPACIQQFMNDEFGKIFNNPPLPESEDCLYLNVFAPGGSVPGADKPVMFWIHGGSFQLGSASVPEYDGSVIAAQHDVIVVTTNYRTNVFGFPASPQIALEQRNLGFMDQRQALTWVTQNIRAFGGDPSKVTIFGESSGGYSVKQLLANPPSPLQFRAAIMQSQALGDQGDGDKSWAALADDLGCNSTTSGISQLECMRSSPADQIRAILNSGTLGFPPAVDNKTNNGNFEAAINAHTVANVPILLGTNADEGTVLTSVMPDSQILLQNFLGNDTHSQALARAAYPHDATEKELKSRIVTDYLYTCTTSAIANVLNDANYKVWRYYFNASFLNTQPFPGAGAWHTSEISLVFGTYPRNYMTTPQQIELSKFMQHSWASFAKDPERGPGWTMIEGGKEDLQVIGANGTSWGQPASIESVEDICSVYSSAIRIGRL